MTETWGQELKSGCPDLDTQCRALEGCWTGILITNVGKTVDCGGTQRTIGQFCNRCNEGRLQLLNGNVQCNVCLYKIGRVTRFVDDEPPMERALRFLRSEFSIVETYQCRETFKGNPIPIGRPYWTFAEVRGQRTMRVAWEGQKCPSCPNGQLKFFVGPEEVEEGLVCNNPYCYFGLSVKAGSPKPNGDAMWQWKNVPLESSTPACLARIVHRGKRPASNAVFLPCSQP